MKNIIFIFIIGMGILPHPPVWAQTNEEQVASFCQSLVNDKTERSLAHEIVQYLQLSYLPQSTFQEKIIGPDFEISHSKKQEQRALYLPSVIPNEELVSSLKNEIKEIQKNKLTKKLRQNLTTTECLEQFSTYPIDGMKIMTLFEKMSGIPNLHMLMNESQTLAFLKKNIKTLDIITSPEMMVPYFEQGSQILLIAHSDQSGKIHLPWGGTLPKSFFMNLPIPSLAIVVCNIKSVIENYALGNLKYPVIYPEMNPKFQKQFSTQTPVLIAPALLSKLSYSAKLASIDNENDCQLRINGEFLTPPAIFLNGTFVALMAKTNSQRSEIRFDCNLLIDGDNQLFLTALGEFIGHGVDQMEPNIESEIIIRLPNGNEARSSLDSLSGQSHLPARGLIRVSL